MRLQSINQYTDVCCWRMWFTQVLLTELTASLNSSKIKLRIRITINNQSINLQCTHNELVVGPKRSVYNSRRQSLFSLPEIIEISSSTGQAANIIIKSPWKRNIYKFTITPFKERQHFFAMCNSNKSKEEQKNWLRFPAASRINPWKADFQAWRQQAQQAAKRKTIRHESLWLIWVQLHLAPALRINPMSRRRTNNLHSYCLRLKHARETRCSEQALSKGCCVAMGQRWGKARSVKQLVLDTVVWKDRESCGVLTTSTELTHYYCSLGHSVSELPCVVCAHSATHGSWPRPLALLLVFVWSNMKYIHSHRQYPSPPLVVLGY